MSPGTALDIIIFQHPMSAFFQVVSLRIQVTRHFAAAFEAKITKYEVRLAQSPLSRTQFSDEVPVQLPQRIHVSYSWAKCPATRGPYSPFHHHYAFAQAAGRPTCLTAETSSETIRIAKPRTTCAMTFRVRLALPKVPERTELPNCGTSFQSPDILLAISGHIRCACSCYRGNFSTMLYRTVVLT